MSLNDPYRIFEGSHIEARGVVNPINQPVVVLDDNLCVTTAWIRDTIEGGRRGLHCEWQDEPGRPHRRHSKQVEEPRELKEPPSIRRKRTRASRAR
ncbi:hypothetical protein [Mycoplana sp. MJR14]|uniref:hypothetical protein n=1 Tax=Mycoplana sp. MJR14 TaxID=3032583 RepID=UPI0023DC17DF|nr:hypothetical protein [Mycoplana sp. MJR14]MDF1631239.1 hypothetical protein [Mycoplana sp. MJR14]